MIEGRDGRWLRFDLKYLEPFTKFMEILPGLMPFFCQAALLITKSLFGEALKPSSLLGLLKRLKNLKNSNK